MCQGILQLEEHGLQNYWPLYEVDSQKCQMFSYSVFQYVYDLMLAKYFILKLLKLLRESILKREDL